MVVDRLLKTMNIFLPVDIEALLVLLVCYAIIFFAPEHDGGALHIVVNYVFQYRYHGLILKRVEEDFLLGRDLNLFVAHFEIRVGVQTESVINHPRFESFFISTSFHQQYLGRTPSYEDLIGIQIYVAYVLDRHPLQLKL